MVYVCVCVRVCRLWDVELDDHYALTLDESLGFEKGELLNCVSFCASKRKIYTVTNLCDSEQCTHLHKYCLSFCIGFSLKLFYYSTIWNHYDFLFFLVFYAYQDCIYLNIIY